MNTPAAESLLGALAGALAGGAAHGLYRKAVRDPRVFEDPGHALRVRRASMVLGALAGGLNPFLRDADYSSPRSFFRSMTTPHTSFSEGDAGFDPRPFFASVDKDSAESVVKSDLFLQPYEREGVAGLIRSAPDKAEGRTSPFGLTQAALRAGVDFVPAYSFGELAGKALGVPDTVARSLSRMGALAFALRSSGITEYMR